MTDSKFFLALIGAGLAGLAVYAVLKDPKLQTIIADVMREAIIKGGKNKDE